MLSESTTVHPTYSPNLRSSHYVLEEESEYSIECSYYDPAGGVTPLRIELSAADVDIRNSFEWGGGAPLDTRRLPLTTRTLKSRSAPAYMKFYAGPKPAAAPVTTATASTDPNYVEIHWRLSQKSFKPLTFGLFTVIGVIGLFIAQTALKTSKGDPLTNHDLALTLFGTLLAGLAAGLLFKFFNKI